MPASILLRKKDREYLRLAIYDLRADGV